MLCIDIKCCVFTDFTNFTCNSLRMCYLENTVSMNRYKQKGITVHKNFVLLCMTSLRIDPILGKHSWYHVKRSPNHPYPQRIRRSGIGKVCPHCLPSVPPNPPPNHSRWPNSLPSHHRALASILQCDTRSISLSLQPGFPPARAFESAL